MTTTFAAAPPPSSVSPFPGAPGTSVKGNAASLKVSVPTVFVPSSVIVCETVIGTGPPPKVAAALAAFGTPAVQFPGVLHGPSASTAQNELGGSVKIKPVAPRATLLRRISSMSPKRLSPATLRFSFPKTSGPWNVPAVPEIVSACAPREFAKVTVGSTFVQKNGAFVPSKTKAV